jgi:hypothetical protein
MKIDKNLNVVTTVTTTAGEEMRVHSMPIGMAVYEANYLLLARTHSELQSLGIKTGPSVARLALADIASQFDMTKSHNALMSEIRRLTNVCYPTKNGFEQMPLESSIDEGFLDEETLSYVESLLVFFTLIRWVYPPEYRPMFMDMMRDAWNLASTPFTITEYANSLRTSTKAATSGGTAAA